MTRQEFIDNFQIDKKLKKLENLKNMSFDKWFLNQVKENLIKKGDIRSIKLYLKYRKLYLDKNITEKELLDKDTPFDFFISMYNNRTHHLEWEINNFHRDLEYFCEIPNLSFEEWLNTYYVENLKKIPEDLMHPKHKEWRLLRVDVFNGKLEESEYLKIMKCNPTEGYQSKDYIIADYKGYLQNQVTLPTISWIE